MRKPKKADIKFGTDGWRAIIAKDYTLENVARVAYATAKWMKNNFGLKKVVLGYDCRFGGKMFAETTAKVLLKEEIQVLMSKGFVSTPMISYGTLNHTATIGIVITASHNPPNYNGFKIKGYYGGPLLESQVKEIETFIPDIYEGDLEAIFLDDLEKKGKFQYVDLEQEYIDLINENIDIDLIRKSKKKFAYNAMFGAGQNVLKRLFPDMEYVNCEFNPSFHGTAPEPILKNLKPFAEIIKKHGGFDIGFATDGDADRIGVFNGRGDFIDSHHVILILILYLHYYREYTGKVCTAFSTTSRIKTMCDHFGLELDVVKIGFKHICDIMLEQDVVVGGEESGGIAVKGHVPERDGIWVSLMLLEFLCDTGKTLDEIIADVYAITGSFAYERSDLHLNEKLKQQIIRNCKAGKYTEFGSYKVNRVEDLDGFKFFVNEKDWILIRPSGTEPVLRIYAEASSTEGVQAMLTACKETILN